MGTNEKVKKNGIVKIIILIILITTVIALAGFAYARYVTRLSGQSTADIAQWSFKVNDKTNESFTIDLADTRIKANDEVQMQDGYIGPGTSGAFDIRLDATGSEVSLKYDVNIDVDNANNTKLPKNLIFYSDSTMQNAIYHENNIINLNGFIGVADNSKVHTKTVYWKWAYETGQTQAEINTNDRLDSYWMGKDISIAINVIGKQVNENPTTGDYTVTFDANGGTLQGYGNSSQATKIVTYGENYGDLPIPTREGYEFEGWMSENLFNEGSILGEIRNVTYSDEHWNFRVDDAHTKYFSGISQISGFKENTQYTLTVKGYVATWSGIDKSNFRIFFHYTDGSNSFEAVKDNDETQISYSSQEGKTIDYIGMTYGYGGTVHLSQVKLEEGILSTPYFITINTPVVAAKNHNLIAKWKSIN